MLRSWALPKGLPVTVSQDRLAVAVPDHELDHLRYEDADKQVADIGWWEEVDRTDKRLLLVLHGRSSSVRYALIRTDRDWLVHRTRQQPSARGAAARPAGVRTTPTTESKSDL